MNIKKILCTALAIVGFGVTAGLHAQGQTQTWKGIDISTVTGTTTATGKKVFLYNVGTGRFMIHGGDWGIQARLFYNDSGKKMTVYKYNSYYRFNTGMTTYFEGQSKSNLACNAPWTNGIEDSQWTGSGTGTKADKTYTVIFDAPAANGNWILQRVADETGDTYTYYMYQNLPTRDANSTATTNNRYWLGAVYGDNWGNHDGDGYGYLISLSSSYDKAVWSQLVRFDGDKDKSMPKDKISRRYITSSYPDNWHTPADYRNTMVKIFNDNTQVSIEDLYKWRIVSEEELLASMTTADVGSGLSTNLTYEIVDRGLERNDMDFFTNWQAYKFAEGVDYPTEGRYRYTWGVVDALKNTNGTWNGKKVWHYNSTPRADGDTYLNPRTVSGEGYKQPVRLKAQWDDKPNAKFGFLEFEGVGTTTSYVDAPEAGVYKIACYGFYQGPNAGYLFATTKNPAQLTLADMSSSSTNVSLSTAFQQVSPFDKTISGTATSTSKTGVMGAGYDFVYNKDNYRREVEILVNKGDRIYFGVAKLDATQTASASSGYYYDSDWVGADQFELIYMGTDYPVLFDEEESTLAYLGNKEYNNRAVNLKRTMVKDQWNSFVFPINLNALQVRTAFGNACQLAEITELGTYSGQPTCVDFAYVPLPATGTAIEAGKFYLVKPSADPLKDKNGNEYYSLGRFSFNTSDFEDVVHKTVGVADNEATRAYAETHNIPDEWFENEISTYGSYVNGTTIPKGAYVMAYKNADADKNVKLYTITKPTTIKGFRGWIEDAAIATSAGTMSLGGIFDVNTIIDPTTGIEHLRLEKPSTEQGVFDLSGRRVANTLEGLPRGLYIVNGKKMFVK